MPTPIPAYAQAFTYRMPVGFPGAVSRTYATKVEPNVIDVASPPQFCGQAVVFDTTALAMRPPVVGDSTIHGFVVRSFPTIGNFPVGTPGVDPIGTANVPLSGALDVMVSGYMINSLSGGGNAVRGQRLYVWVGATAGSHVNGGLEIAPAVTYVTAPKGGGNTGNGTFTVAPVMGTISPDFLRAGVFSVVFTSATQFNVYNALGEEMQPGTTGTPYIDPQIMFTLSAGGTAFVAGDQFNITASLQTINLGNGSYWMGAADANGFSEFCFRV